MLTMAKRLASWSLLAILLVPTFGCEAPPIYEYLRLSPSASDEALQSAWDLKFPPGTDRTALTEQILAENAKYPPDSDVGWELTELENHDGDGENEILISAIGWRPSGFPLLKAVRIFVHFDAENRIISPCLYSHILGP